jgi:hypothetical protein
MATNEVYMNVPAVRDISKNFGNIGEVLTNVVKVLDVLINTLKAVAFIGLVATAALAQFLEMIKPYIEQMAEKCAELSKDLGASVDAYERGDALGATKFY